jgi:hypothetical protein
MLDERTFAEYRTGDGNQPRNRKNGGLGSIISIAIHVPFGSHECHVVLDQNFTPALG